MTRTAHPNVVLHFIIALLAVGPVGCQATPNLSEVFTGSPRTGMSILTWNLDWFQHPERGPADDAVQFESVLEVLDRSDANLVALQEVSDSARFHALLDRLPHYRGVITEHPWPQQLALVYRASEFTLVASDALFGLDDAGRPPLIVELQAITGIRTAVVVVHAKAGVTANDYARRERFARGLADRLNDGLDADARIVLGDFNDRLQGSLVADRPSPYEMLLQDTGLASPTAALETGSERSTIWGDTVDHVLLDRTWPAASATPAADVLRDELLADRPDYVEEVSDHFPVRVDVPDG